MSAAESSIFHCDSIGDAVSALPMVVVAMALPWMFGGVQTSSQIIWFAAVLVSLVLTVWVRRGTDAPLSGVGWCLVLAIGLGVIQQLPLGPLVGALSPQAGWLWSQAAIAEDAPNEQFALRVGQAVGDGLASFSVYPFVTRRDTALLTTALALVLMGGQLFGRPGWQLPLWAVVAANGTLFAFFGLAQQLTWNGKLYGVVELTQGGRPFAAFVNANNAGGYLNICLAAAVGWAWYAFGSRRADSSQTRRQPAGRARSDREPRNTGSSRDLRRLQARLLSFVSQLDGVRILSLMMLVSIFAGLLCTLSRGAWVATMAGAAVLLLILSRRRRVAFGAVAFVTVIALAFWLTDWLGRTPAIAARWQSLQSQATNPSDGRLAHWADGLQAGSDFWLLGSGLGTYRFVYQPYSRTAEVLFYHAENQFVEAFCEGGLVGVGLLIAAIASLGYSCRTLLRSADAERRVSGLVGAFALTSQVVHGLFDFAIYLPANLAVFALLCGALSGAAQLEHLATSGRRRPWSPSRGMRPQLGLASLIGVGLVFGLVDLERCQAVERAVALSRSDTDDQPRDLTATTRGIHCLTAALARLPMHAEGQYELAQLWLRRYRIQTLQELRLTAPADMNDAELWKLTAPLIAQGTVYRYLQTGQSLQLENWQRSDPVRTDVANAARALLASIRRSAVLPRPYLSLSEIAPLLSTDVNVAAWLHAASFLAGGNQPLLRECAIACLQGQQPAVGLPALRRLVELNPALLPDSLRLAATYVDSAAAVAVIAPPSPVDLVSAIHALPADSTIRPPLAQRILELLPTANLSSGEKYWLEANVHVVRDEDQRAIESLKKAVADAPANAAWRYELARLLLQHGQTDQAWEHAKICLRTQPANEQFDALFRELIRARRL